MTPLGALLILLSDTLRRPAGRVTAATQAALLTEQLLTEADRRQYPLTSPLLGTRRQRTAADGEEVSHRAAGGRRLWWVVDHLRVLRVHLADDRRGRGGGASVPDRERKSSPGRDGTHLDSSLREVAT